jgi:hypothetical protein
VLGAVVLLLTTATTASACPAGSTLPPGVVFTPEQVSIGSQLAQVRGHLGVGLELLRAGDPAYANVHGAHPVVELLEVLTDGVSTAGGDVAALSTAIEAAADAFQHHASDAETVEAAVEAAAEATVVATDEVAGDSAALPSYTGSVIADLLAIMGAEYGASTADGEFVNIPEYQDAYGFLQEAKAMYATIQESVAERSALDARLIEEAFASLDVAMPGPVPQDVSVSPDEVAALASDIGRGLRLGIGAYVVRVIDPAEQVAAIETLLDEVVVASAAGDRDLAAERALTAYLSHYELIEGKILEAAPDLNARLEPLLSSDLRAAILDGTHDQVERLVAEARELLPMALEAIGEG